MSDLAPSPAAFRRDPLTGALTLLAPGRRGRPIEGRDLPLLTPSTCPFCPGNERATPPEVLRRPADLTRPWHQRVVPNKYPALGERGAAAGPHYVIVDSPRHDHQVWDWSPVEYFDLLCTYREALAQVYDEEGAVFGVLFKNQGPAAGASLRHPHSQLLGLPVVTDRMAVQVERFSRGPCPLCVEASSRHRERLRRRVATWDHFVALCPKAPRFPFETRLVPRDHQACFTQASDTCLLELAELLAWLMGRLALLTNQAAFNWVLATAPRPAGVPTPFHWHLEILPRLVGVAGFEWATGCHINELPPEEAARALAVES